MNIVVYSFQNYPWAEEIISQFPKAHFFKKLKAEMSILCERISVDKPDYVIGIAKPIGQKSRLEKEAINKFNKTKLVLQNGPSAFNLYIPESIPDNLSVSTNSTDSFCNWTAYKLAYFIHQKNLKTKLTFLHGTPSDLQKILDILSEEGLSR